MNTRYTVLLGCVTTTSRMKPSARVPDACCSRARAKLSISIPDETGLRRMTAPIRLGSTSTGRAKGFPAVALAWPLLAAVNVLIPALFAFGVAKRVVIFVCSAVCIGAAATRVAAGGGRP